MNQRPGFFLAANHLNSCPDSDLKKKLTLIHIYLLICLTFPGVLTFLFFPATVWTAYVADKRLFCYKYMSKTYRMNKHGMIVQTEKGDIEARAQETFKVLNTKCIMSVWGSGYSNQYFGIVWGLKKL